MININGRLIMALKRLFSKDPKVKSIAKFYDAILLEDVREPGIPPCGHVFDKSSISTYIEAQESEHKSLNCPSCRKEFKKIDVLPLVPAWERMRGTLSRLETKVDEYKSKLDQNEAKFGDVKQEHKRLSDHIQISLVTDEQKDHILSLKQTLLDKQKSELKEMNRKNEAYQTELNELKTILVSRQRQDTQIDANEKLIGEQISELQEAKMKSDKQTQELNEIKAKNAEQLGIIISQKIQLQTAKTEIQELQQKYADFVYLQHLKLEEKCKVLESRLSVAEMGDEYKSTEDSRSLLKIAECLKNVFKYEKKRHDITSEIHSLTKRIAESKSRHNIMATIKSIVQLKSQLKSLQTEKSMLEVKCQSDAKTIASDITKIDPVELVKKLSEIKQQYVIDNIKQDEKIENLDRQVKQLQQNVKIGFSELQDLFMARDGAVAQIKEEQKQEQMEVEDYSDVSKLDSLAFFRDHRLALEKWVEKSKLNAMLLSAVKNNNYDAAEAALKKSANPDGTKKCTHYYDKYSPLYHAVINLDFRMIKLLLNYGANANLQLGDKLFCEYTCLTYLLAKGYSNQAADLYSSLVNKMDVTALNSSLSGVVSNINRPTALLFALANKDCSLAIKLINKHVQMPENNIITILRTLNIYDKDLAHALYQRRNSYDKAFSMRVEQYMYACARIPNISSRVMVYNI